MRKILLIRFSSIGDIVLTTPVVRSLKNQIDCVLHVVTKAKFKSIYLNNPYIDKVYSFQKDPLEILDQMYHEEYDHVADLQKNLRSIRLRRKLGRPGSSFPKLNIQKWMLVNLKINRLPDLHIVDRYFQAVKELGVRNDGKGLDFFIPQQEMIDPKAVDPRLANGYIGFVIGSRHETKMFPVSMVAEVIDRMKVPVVLMGGPEDKEKGDQVLKQTLFDEVFNCCGSYTLNQSASLVQQARVIITNDTGLMHIAAAFRKPIVSIWGNTVPAFGMYPYLPGRDSPSFLAEVSGLKCRPCSKLGFQKCPKQHFDCMMRQDVDAITRHATGFYRLPGSDIDG